MFNTFITGTKIAAYATWTLLILSLLGVIKAPFATYSYVLFGMMATLHILGYVFIKTKYSQLTQATFVQCMLIGYAHWLPMIVSLKDQPKTA